MSKIQTKTCLKCNQNKEGLTFQVPIVDSQPPKSVTKHYCWTDLEDLLKKELDKCEEWERNKKELFKEWLRECQQHKTFDWPWRERSIIHYGFGRWDRIVSRCIQCKIKLHWDVTPYRDSKHICSFCSNCNQPIKSGKKDEHFYWQETTPIYKCKKSEKDDYWRESCMYCDTAKLLAKGVLKSEVSNLGKDTFSFAQSRPNAKGHTNIITKRHATDIRDMTIQEWNDILPTLKDTISRTMKVYRPVGFFIRLPTGWIEGKDDFHFFIGIVPKYKKGYGSVAIKEHFTPATPEELQEVHQKLQDDNGVVSEKSKVIAELDNVFMGRVLIKPKNPIANTIDNFLNLDPEIWSQMGELFKQCVEIQAANFEGCTNWGVGIDLGEWGDVGETTSPFLKLSMRPKLVNKRGNQWGGRGGRTLGEDGKPIGSMENERIAEKLRGPEGYYEKWKGDKDYLKHKAERERERERAKPVRTLDLRRSGCYRDLYFWNYSDCNLVQKKIPT